MPPTKTAGKGGSGKGAKKQETTQVDTAPEYKYPDLAAVLYIRVNRKTGPITPAMARDWLGWEEIPEGDKDKNTPSLLTDYQGSRIRCTKNDHNRPFDEGHARKLASDMLNRHWADSMNSLPGEDLTCNGEAIIIGRSGRVLSGQHRLIGLVLAGQRFDSKQEGEHWQSIWGKGHTPSIESVVTFGVDESEKTTGTLDNVKPRSLSDVLFSNNNLYGKYTAEQRKVLTKMTEHCIRFLWDRTHEMRRAYHPQRSHSEFLDFLSRHPHVVECVDFIFNLNKRPINVEQVKGKGDKMREKKTLGEEPIGRRIPPGYASALLYLMGCSGTTDADVVNNYNDGTPERSELDSKGKDVLDWGNLPAAKDYWKAIAEDRPTVLGLHQQFASYYNAETGEPDLSYADPLMDRNRIVITKGWSVFAAEGAINSVEDLDLTWIEVDENGKPFKETPSEGTRIYKTLADNVTCGGLDMGKYVKPKPVKTKKANDNGEATDTGKDSEDEDDNPSEDEIYSEADEIRGRQRPTGEEDLD